MANYRITEVDDLTSGGAKTKARQNIAAIKLLKEIETEQRSATAEEQAILIRYSGWGSAPDIFTAKPAWAELKGELEELLTAKELAAARASTVNAFYTDTAIAAEIYKGVEQLGFSGGKILDPSLGATGIFEGTMPAEMANGSEIVGVELDELSGRIASQLYPEATVHIRGFQDTILADDHFDLTISNVPFSEVGVSDPRYKRQPVNTLHDYFFAKGLDKVRPGGLLVYITSTGTMQSAKGKPFRQYMADRANLVGAMRLPGDAFKKNAGTEVTTDLIILQKLGNGVVPNGIAWTELAETDVLDSEGQRLRTNEYYAQQPELMLGQLSDDKLYPGRLALKGDGRDIITAIQGAFASMPSGIYQPQLALTADTTQRILVPPELQSKAKQNGFTVHEDKLMQRRGDYLEPCEMTGKPYERVIGLLAVRDAVQTVFDVQLQKGSDDELSAEQNNLIEVYDGFVQKNGYIHQRGNRLAFRGDPDYPLLLALENYSPQEKTAEKTDIFFKRTIQTYEPKTHADSAKEGLLFSLNELGKVDIGYIAKLTSQSRFEVISDLQEEQLIFRDPTLGEWQTSGEYLSGNVKQKLKLAQEEVNQGNHTEYAINVEALQAVQPEPLLPGDIDVRLGAVWVAASDVEDFTHQLLGIDEGVTIEHSKIANTWYVKTTGSVDSLAANNSIHGTSEVSATTLISQTLNLRSPTIYKPHPTQDTRIIDQDETAAARLKQEEIKERFKDWIWQDPKRTDRLTKVYNDTFNTNRERLYDGSHLELPGKNPNFVLRKHQANAVYRSLSGNTLFAHAVGAGKTAAAICAAMEQKRLGLADKPMFVVPNHLLEQWAGDIKHLYPTANVLAATKEDAKKSNRQELMARIATGQWDAVVVTHSAFGKLKLSEQSQTIFLSEEYAKVEEAILSVDDGNNESRRVMKDLEKKKTKLEEKINAIANSDTKDETITFEQMGVDLLIVDESHYFKNLGYVTKMRNIAGLPNTESQRAFDMHMKLRHIGQVRGEGKGIIFLTGTPITNSMAELYTLQRYLQPEELKRTGLESFDDWASVFGEMVSSAELSAAGKFQVKSRFASFVNLPELMGSIRQVMDVQTADMLNLPVPTLLNGKPTIRAVPATDEQLDYMDDMVRRVNNMSNVDPTEDNMLKITGDGKAVSVDTRLRIHNAQDDPNSKINRFVDDAYDFWNTHRNEKTHLAWCDLGTPKPAGQFSLYQDIKKKLVEKGVPEHEIAFAQSYKSDAQKLQLQKDFNQGKIPLLISGAQLETGFNGQQRLARISHLTVPWRPDQIEQRDGRMIRQGNRNDTVESIRYVTQGRNQQPGMDGYFWQTLEKKAGFISQVMKGDTTVRRMSDVSEEALDFATAKAIATGNPLIMEMATLDNTVRQLSGQKRSHTNANYQIRRQLEDLPERIERVNFSIEASKIDLQTANQAKRLGKITLNGQQLSLSQTEEIGKRLRSMASAIRDYKGKEDKITKAIGSLGEFKIYLSCYTKSNPPVPTIDIVGKKSYRYEKILGSNQRAYEPIRRVLETDIAEAVDRLEKQREGMQRNLNDLSQHAQQPFAKEDELAAAIKRLAEVHKELNAETEAQKEKSDDSELSTNGSSSEVSPDNRHRVAPKEKQEGDLTEHVALFLETVGLQHKVVSTEGFYLALKHNKRDADLIIDTDDGERIKLTTNVKTGKLPAVDVTAVFQLDRDGILTLDSIKGNDGSRSSEIVLAVRLGRYLSANRNKFISPLQATDKIEPSQSAHRTETSRQAVHHAEPTSQRPEGISTPGPSEEGLTADIAGSTRPRVAPHNEQRSGISERITKFLEAVDLQHKAAATEGLLLTFKHEEQGTDLIIEANGGDRIKINTSVQIAQSPAQDVSAVFQLDQDGILALESIETAEESKLGKPALAARLAHYLSVNKEKFVPLSQTINAVENSQSALETKADEVPSQEVRSLETDEDKPATQRRSRTEPVNAESEPQPLRQSQRAFGVSEEVTLRIRSLYSGKETEVTLPSDTAVKPAVSSDNTKDTLQTETTPRSHGQTQTEDARPVTAEDDPRKDTDSTPLESGEAEPKEVSSTDELSVFQGKHIAVAKNLERKGLEVRFTQKPEQTWTKQLKSQKFRFSKSDNDPRWWRKLSTASIPWTQKFAEGYEATQIEAATVEQPAAPVTDCDKPETAQAQPTKVTAAVNTNAETEQPTATALQANSNQSESTPAQPIEGVAAVSTQPAAAKQQTKKDPQTKESRPRPGFKRYLSCKEQYPQAVALIRHPHGYYESYQEDATLVADALSIQVATADSGYAEHGKVNISRVFQGQVEALTTKLQEAHSVAIVKAQGKITIHSQTEIVVEKAQAIQPAIQHQRRAERNVAKLIHNADLATELMSGEEFNLRIENGAFSPLKIESHYAGDGERLLYLTHYTEQPSQDVPGKMHKILDSEAVFVISASGMLKLEETAVQNPVGAGELRQRNGGDRTFAGSFTRRLLQQGYDKAAVNSIDQSPGQKHPDLTNETNPNQQQPLVERTAEPDVKEQRTEPTSANRTAEAVLEVSQPSEGTGQTTQSTISAATFIQQTIEQRDPHLAAELTQPATHDVAEAKVDQLRQWYISARAQQRPADVLNSIKAKGIAARDNGSAPLSALDIDEMNQDLEWLAQHPLKERPIPIATLKEWYRANTLLSGSSHTNRITEIAKAFQTDGVDNIYLEKPDYQQAARDIRALRSTISSDLSSVWTAAEKLNLLSNSETGRHYSGNQYKISHLQNEGVIKISTLDESREVAINESNKTVMTNTFSIDDVKELRRITESMKSLAVTPTNQMQQ